MNTNRLVVLVAGLGRPRRLVLIASLRLHGYRTLEAEDGFEALQVVIGGPVDVLIAEEEMPGLTGRELIEVIRKHGAVRHFLLVSDAPQSHATGPGQDILVAPFDPDQLLLRLQEALLDPNRSPPAASLAVSTEIITVRQKKNMAGG
jgi:CheY-like chemotaxis protein